MKRRGIQAIALAAFGFILMITNPWFSFIDDEVNVVVTATQPVSNTIALFVSGGGQHEHPPLSDILLHYWLWITTANLTWLRLFGVVFFLAGLWILAETAYAVSERDPAAYLTLTVGILWPYGFHFGRLAIWYSFSFFLVALLTYARVKLDLDWKLHHLAGFTFAALALIYTNYFGWTLIACMLLDFAISRKTTRRTAAMMVGVVLFLVVAYVPIMSSFVNTLENRLPVAGQGVWGRVLYFGFNLYCVFVSESVAPWIWPLSIPVGLAITYTIVWVLWRGPGFARRLFIYFLGLMLLMSLLGILNTKRLLLLSCWLLLPLALTLDALLGKCGSQVVNVEASDNRGTRRLAFAVVLIAAIGWAGIITRRFYSAPHFIEPWRQVADDAAAVVRNGGEVISNSRPFLFYLSYELGAQRQVSNWSPADWADSINALVLSPSRWASARRPAPPEVMLVQGTAFGDDSMAQMKDTEQWLEQKCHLRDTRHLLPNPGYEWKHRFFPEAGQLPWRIEIRSYQCPVTFKVPALEKSATW
ncbi:MAG: hypothetical protein ABSD20_10380 [Terriglobales bacterium]